jgi:hypothetical protein
MSEPFAGQRPALDLSVTNARGSLVQSSTTAQVEQPAVVRPS